MKLSEKWLYEWVNPQLTTQQLAEKLTMAGLEMESITPIGADMQHIRIGKVLAVAPHPDADRLRVCQVSVDETAQALTIICGAANVRAGLKVAVAMIGAVLPGNITIKQAKIRGVESSGMLCSESELGLAESSNGIMELPQDAPIGQNLADYLHLPDHSLDISLTPNRGDCLSVAGIAREVAALCACPIHPPKEQAIAATSEVVFPVTVSAPDACPRYLGRVIKAINPKAHTPLWLAERLRRSGLRLIHPVVDVVNYVMLELGQPLHAFDLSQLSGRVEVRYSQSGETVTLLDGQTLSLTEPVLVIADSQQILALAGIMGSQASAVSAATTDIFLESAFFTPEAICRGLRRLPVKSDAAHRFERGVDPELPLRALERVTELLLPIVGGQPGPVITVESPQQLPKPVSLHLRRTRIARILGIEIPDSQVVEILQRLGMQVKKEADGWQVTVPSQRFDLRIEVDLIEELARLYGYDHIPSQALSASLAMQPSPEAQLSATRLRNFWADRGYSEVINYSFVEAKLAEQLDPEHNALPLCNPISQELAVMRTSLWPGLIQTALFNLNRQQTRMLLFEIGVCFKQGEPLVQENRLAGLVVGSASSEQWALAERPVDFFDIKGDLEALLALTQQPQAYAFIPKAHPALHPGRSAIIEKAGVCVGYVGALHPQLQRQLDLPTPVYVFELNLEAIAETALPIYTTPSKYPSVRRDLAFILAEEVTYQQIRQTIENCAGEMLKNLQLFDIYRGENIAPGKKSVALGLTFQLASRTLIDQEVDAMVNQVVQTLGEQYKALLRE